MNRQIHVLHIVPQLFGPGGLIGGGERYALELAKHMADHVPTTLVSFGDQERRCKTGKLDVRVIGNPWYVRGQRFNPVKLSLLTELRKADIVHCHQKNVLMSSLAALFCRISRQRIFVSDLGGGGWDVSAYISTDNWYDGHLHISEYSKKIYNHSNRASAHIILGGVDTNKFSPGESSSRENIVLYVGRLLPHKGINYLVKALPPDMRLEVIGQPYDQRFVQDLKQLAAGKNVVFFTDCDDEALVSSYHRALCVVLPSVYKDMYGHETNVPELLGQTLLEGMACGVPVICTEVGGMPEVVEDSVTGFVVPPNDAESLNRRLCWLRDNPDQAKKMGLAARQRVLEKFTWRAVVERCLQIYSVNF
jgi:glycosyltransferase involved in cell wall biosynthesis